MPRRYTVDNPGTDVAKGHRYGLDITVASTSTVNINTGTVEINDNMYQLNSVQVVTLIGGTASTLYYIYVSVPGDGSDFLALSDFSITVDVPVNGYHPTELNKRYIGYFTTSAASEITVVSSTDAPDWNELLNKPTIPAEHTPPTVYMTQADKDKLDAMLQTPVLYGTTAPPDPTGIPDGTIYLKYIA